MHSIIENIKEILNKKEENLINIIKKSRNKIFEYIDDELKHIPDRLKEADYETQKAIEKLTNKIDEEIKNMNNEREEEISELNDEIKNCKIKIEKWEGEVYENKDDKVNQNEIKISNSIPDSILSFLKNLETFEKENSPLKKNIIDFLSLIHPLIGAGFNAGISVLSEVAKFFLKKFAVKKTEKNYKEGLLMYKEKIEKSLNDYLNNRKYDFIVFKESFILSMNTLVEVTEKDIIISAEKEQETWEDLKIQYEKIKDEYQKEVTAFLGEKI